MFHWDFCRVVIEISKDNYFHNFQDDVAVEKANIAKMAAEIRAKTAEILAYLVPDFLEGPYFQKRIQLARLG